MCPLTDICSQMSGARLYPVQSSYHHAVVAAETLAFHILTDEVDGGDWTPLVVFELGFFLFVFWNSFFFPQMKFQGELQDIKSEKRNHCG